MPNPLAWLPMGVRTFVSRRLEEVSGVGLVALCVFCLLSLLSWHQADPSINNATGLAPRNWMGVPGAYIADILFQTLGIGTLVLLAPPAVWGARLLVHERPNRLVRRVAAWLFATLFAATLLATFPMLKFWALAPRVGFGGVLGDILAGFGLDVFAPLTGRGLAFALTALIAAPVAGWLSLFAADLEYAQIADAVRRIAAWRAPAEDVEEEEETLSYPLRSRRRRTREEEDEEDAPVVRAPRKSRLPRRPDVEPSRLRVAIWSLTDGFTDWRDRMLHRGEYGALTAEEIAIARLGGNSGGFGKRGSSDEDIEGEDFDAEFDDEDEDENEDDDESPSRGASRLEPRLDGKPGPRVSRAAPKVVKPSKRAVREAQPRLALEPAADYQLPPLNLLARPKAQPAQKIADESFEQNARLLESVLDDFGIRGEIINVRPGPVVTLYELEPAPGIKSSRVIALADDIARSMSAVSARVAVVPGRNVIGIELPNARREMVYLRELLETADYESSAQKLALALGKNIGGEAVISDLARMPHLLIAGTTGSGKSVGINTMILSILYRLSPDQCKLIMIDPKMLELSVYDGIPHLLAPVVTEPKKAVVALKWVVKEMEDRYRKMSKVGVRNIDGYNTRVIDADAKGEVLVRTVQTGFDRETGKAIYEEEEMDLSPMPFIVVIVDEMADLMMVAGKDIEGAVQRLAQMARAAGIHIITATQRPSVDVITGTIKANFPTRISFQVTSKIDSRTILGEQGAEQLLGQGDMLYMAGGGRIRRVHGPFVSDEEVEKVVTFLKKQGVPEYLEAITAEPEEGGPDMFGLDGEPGSGDDLYDKAVAIVARDKRASTSYIQRRLQIGYNRAARLIELMEEQGVVSPPNHQGKREVLVGDH
ncbi:MAG: DNA translocase FtsK [Parvibaculum sp.]|uniref:DNA translocase FtsK n=1 Tax=Parvibaculum sp. TaxID=2024848 RepID=UPI0025D5C303|nr:DNA translocase FtsK [Parvibaculum sp.]MCE9648035.1 DNA translocase FtsK [Parvibaculum sp.]